MNQQEPMRTCLAESPATAGDDTHEREQQPTGAYENQQEPMRICLAGSLTTAGDDTHERERQHLEGEPM